MFYLNLEPLTPINRALLGKLSTELAVTHASETFGKCFLLKAGFKFKEHELNIIFFVDVFYFFDSFI